VRGNKRNRVLMFLFRGICWTLWLNRNDLIFKNKIISSPRALIYTFVFFTALDDVTTGEDRVELEWYAKVIRTLVPEGMVAMRVD
jgi:hypothetical protein